MKKEKFITRGMIVYLYNSQAFVFEDENKNQFDVISKTTVTTPIFTEVEIEGTIEDGHHYVGKITPKPTTDYGAITLLERLFTKKQSSDIANYFEGPGNAVSLLDKDWKKFIEIVGDIKGVGPTSLKKAIEKYQSEQLPEDLSGILDPYGFTFEEKLLVFQFLNGGPLLGISDNPYVLYDLGVSFKSVDEIATGFFKVSKSSPMRVKYGIVSSLDRAASMGHLFLFKRQPRDDSNLVHSMTLFGELQRTLKLYNEEKLFLTCIEELKKEYVIVEDNLEGNETIYGTEFYHQENNLTNSIFKYIKPLHSVTDQSVVNGVIEKHEKHQFKLDILQKDAVNLSINNQLSILTGPPGSGKTTIIELIIKCYQELYPDKLIACAAPTGKASNRMSETIENTGLVSTTIHRLLKPTMAKGVMSFFYNRRNKLPHRLVVIDEVSMVDYELMQNLLDACTSTTQILFVGDEHQLSSIAPGSLLLEMIKSDVIPKTVLTKIFRQDGDSSILKNSEQIRAHGTMDYSPANDFRMVKVDSVEKITEAVLKFAMDRRLTMQPLDWTILTSYNTGALGVDVLNTKIQEVYNPKSPQTPEVKSKGLPFRQGDKVLQTVNDDNLGIVNGSVGRIRTITEQHVYVDFIKDEDWVALTYDKIDNLKLAYVMTIHKSQGSEYKDVCLVVPSAHKTMLNRPLVYTGLSRAREFLEIVGTEKVVSEALKNQASLSQYSALSKKLQIESRRKENGV